MNCHLCGEYVSDTIAAIEADWIPSYWDEASGREVAEPVCPVCCQEYMEYSAPNCDFVLPISSHSDSQIHVNPDLPIW